MVFPVTGGNAAVPQVSALRRTFAGGNQSARHCGDKSPAPPSGLVVETSNQTPDSRKSLDGLRQALASGDPSAVYRAVHAFRHGGGAPEQDSDAATSVADAPPAAPPEVHGHGRRGLIAELGKALASGDLDAARKAFADLTARQAGHSAAQADGNAAQAAPAPGEAPTSAAPPAAEPAPPPVETAATSVPDITAVPPAGTSAPASTDPAPVAAEPSSPTDPAASSSAAGTRQDPLAALATALASGDLAAARKAFSDFAAQQTGGAHGHLHHHGHRHHETAAAEPAGNASPAAAVAPASAAAPADSPDGTQPSAPAETPAVAAESASEQT